MNNADLYQQDINQWIAQQIQLLQEQRFAEVDIEHLIVELEDMGKSNIRELKSRLVILIAHLLKWQFQVDNRSTSWQGSIREQRVQLLILLEDVPSLKRRFNEIVLTAYPNALQLALEETQLAKNQLPESCPYSMQQLLDKQFYPEQ
jgi:hypothetical protein